VRLLPCIAVLVALTAATPALAQAIALPTGPLVGDGATPATLQVLAPAGTRIKASASKGQVLSVIPNASGHVITYVPPPVGERTDMSITAAVRGAGIRQDLDIKLVVVPSWNGTFSITMDPSSVGAGESATVKVRPSSPGPITGQRSLRIAVSDGTIGALVPGGDGSWVGRYTAPRTLDAPLRPVFAVVDAAAPTTFVDAEVLPLTVTRSITLPAPAGSTNLLRVGSREYGPVKASAGGEVTFEVELHPDRSEGTLTSSVDGTTPTTTTPKLPLDVPPSLVVAPLPDKAGGGTVLHVPIACRMGPGTPCAPSQVDISVTGGTAGTPVARGELLVVPWTLPDTGTSTLTAKAGVSVATAKVSTVPSPNTLTLSSDPKALSDDVTTADITARAKDPAGKSVIGRIPGFEVSNSRLMRRPVDNRDGTYTGSWRLNSDAPWLEVLAWPKLDGTGLVPQRLVAWPVVSSMTADGASAITLVVVAEDAVGMPVPNVPLELAVPQGDANLPPTIKTDANGIARVPLKVGVEPGLVELRVQGAGLETAALLWQNAPGTPAPVLPPVGTQPDLEALARWQERVPSLFIGKSAAPVVVAVAPVVVPTPGTPIPGTPVPGTPGTPTTAVPAPGTSPGASPGKAPKVRGGGGGGGGNAAMGYSTARLRAALIEAPFSYSASLNGDTAPTYAPESSFFAPASLGLHVDAEVWAGPSKALGFDFRARGGLYVLDLGAENKANLPWDVSVGGRYRVSDTGTWSTYVSAGVARQSEPLLKYANEARSAAEIENRAVFGPRFGAGVRREAGPAMFEVDFQTLVSPIPDARLELRGDIPVTDSLALVLAGGGDFRYATFKVSGDAAEVVRMRTTRIGGEIRVGVAATFF
jgi:hypothetical protein